MGKVFDQKEMIARRERIYRELGVPPEKEDALEHWQRLQPKPEPERPEHKLDIRPPTMAEIDQLIGQRIAAEHEYMFHLLAELVAYLQSEGAAGPPGPSGARGPSGPPGAPGKLPIVKLWQPDSVTYEAQVVSCDGATYQALRDTGQRPGGSDWICLAVRGRDAKSPRVRGTFSADAHYQELDIVAHGGGSFIARTDDPGPCPGDGWQSLTMPGKRGNKGPPGPRGEKGAKGDEGPPGPIIATWELDVVNYRVRAIMSDGSDGGTLDLRAMFEQFHSEAR
jgi:hypothetical protein